MKRLQERSPSGGTTDHSEEIEFLRRSARDIDKFDEFRAVTLYTAADLLELHDETGISLDHWVNARTLVEQCLGKQILENGA